MIKEVFEHLDDLVLCLYELLKSFFLLLYFGLSRLCYLLKLLLDLVSQLWIKMAQTDLLALQKAL